MKKKKRIKELESRLDDLEKLIMCNSHSLESAYDTINAIVEWIKEQEEYKEMKTIALEKTADSIAGLRKVFRV
jgi:cupin superfamily acireductone dioxygenase involved in methionine salvage